MTFARIRKRFPPGTESAGFALDVEFEAASGVTVLFGPSGSGKTLTLNAIAGFVRPDDGRILIDDNLVFDGPARVHLPPQARNCGYVFQNYALFPHMNLRKNLEFAIERMPRLERYRKVNDMLERFRIGEVAGRMPREVSGGQQQRCSVARALIGSPKLLLLDEPARGLDAPLRAELYAVLRQVRADFGTPILLVTHDLEECFELGDKMLVLLDGKIVQSGPPAKVHEHPATADIARLFGPCNLLPVEIRALDPGKNTSRVRFGDFELTGPYFPGKLIGDRVRILVRPEELTAFPRGTRNGTNHIYTQLVRWSELPHTVRLEFLGGMLVDVPRAAFEPNKHNKDWVVEFPAHSLRTL
jgi:molybdate transport system ATP-binding protein